MRRFHRRGRGQALVEFALIAPLFILILLAVFDLGRGVFMYTSITNAAREAARLAIVNQDVPTIRDRLVRAVGRRRDHQRRRHRHQDRVLPGAMPMATPTPVNPVRPRSISAVSRA